jgi:hypothetical protein
LGRSRVISGLLGEAGMAVDDANKKVFFLNNSSANAVSIEGFSQTSYSSTGTLSVTSATSPGRDLVRWMRTGWLLLPTTKPWF